MVLPAARQSRTFVRNPVTVWVWGTEYVIGWVESLLTGAIEVPYWMVSANHAREDKEPHMEQLALRNKYHCRKALSSIGFLLMGAGVLSIATGCEAIDEPPVTRDVSQAGTRADNPQAQQGQQSGQSGSFGRRGRLPPAPKVLAPQATSTPKPGTTPSSLPAGYSAPGAATSTAPK